MPTFRYSAKAADGKKSEGTLSAANEAEASASLRKQNLTPIMVRAEGAAAKPGGMFSGGPRLKKSINAELLAIMTRQLSTMVGAGIPLLESLEILSEDPNYTYIASSVVEKVRSGTDLSEALASHPRVFTKIYVSMVKAGEASGQLDGILSRLAEYMESTEALKREIKSAMTYPVVSLCMVLLITIGLMVGIVPKFKAIFETIGVELPVITQVLLVISDAMTNFWYLFLLGIAVIAGLFMYWKSTNKGERQWHWITLRLPVFGDLFRKVALSRFSRTFATLIQSGVPILGALEIVANTTGNRIIEDAIMGARDSVRKGETLGEPLSKCDVFPPMVTRMISIGEKSGALEQLLEKISEFYDQQVKATVEALTSLIEPLMIGLMGGLVGGIVLAIFLPILKIQEAVRKK